MRFNALAALAFSSLLAVAAAGCAAPGDAPGDAPATTEGAATSTRTVTASSDPQLANLDALWAVHTLEADGLMIRAYELTGGDPAMNGTSVYLSASAGYETLTWDLGVNIRSITKMERVGAAALKLTGTRDDLDGDEMPVSRPFEMIVRGRPSGDFLDAKLTLERDGETSTVTATTDAATDFMSSVYDLKSAESEEVSARVFETTAGDPAMNGDMLYLTLMSFPESKTYELGLNVASVTSVTTSNGQVRIEGTEDFMDAEGNIGQKPFTYAVKFTITDYAPADEITLVRVR